ncbi:MAG: winged helix-turn-helix transcriptional regulator [Pseudomonadales bacterium]|nr:winged helix-turn-helix transcriptional regulator [Pseudomonadales bacterium]
MLLRDLVHATYWIDDGLQAYMKQHAGMSLPRAQSMMMVYLSEGIDRPADLAKRLRISKQAVRQGLKELMTKEMVTLEPDPTNGRQKIVRFTPRGRELRDIAKEGLGDLERLLVRRIGRSRVDGLRDALHQNWGSAPESDS